MWPKERLAAVEAPEAGRFSTLPLILKGRRLRLNVRTRMAGEVRVEVAVSGPEGRKATVLPGRRFEECVPITGDNINYIVQWKDGEDIGYTAGQTVKLKFRMRAAEIFAFEVF
jgi:hypothetical protein